MTGLKPYPRMSTNVPKRQFGRLKQPAQRLKRLAGLSRLSLKAAGMKLGCSGERVRQLFRIYGVERQRVARCNQNGASRKAIP
jgi:hypothetical protein